MLSKREKTLEPKNVPTQSATTQPAYSLVFAVFKSQAIVDIPPKTQNYTNVRALRSTAAYRNVANVKFLARKLSRHLPLMEKQVAGL